MIERPDNKIRSIVLSMGNQSGGFINQYQALKLPYFVLTHTSLNHYHSVDHHSPWWIYDGISNIVHPTCVCPSNQIYPGGHFDEAQHSRYEHDWVYDWGDVGGPMMYNHLDVQRAQRRRAVSGIAWLHQWLTASGIVLERRN